MNLAPDGRGERAQVWLVCLGLIAMTLAVYFQVRGFQFVNFDDPKYVTTNAHTQAGLTLANVAWAFTTGAVANWHPVTWLSHMADVTLFGSNPGAHHLTSVAFHAANAVLLFLLLRAITGDLWPSAVVAALFAIHPGGPRIIDELAELLALRPRQVEASNAVLRDHGNMSSATLPHVWKAILEDAEVPAGTWVVALAFGPGLTIAGAILRKTA